MPSDLVRQGISESLRNGTIVRRSSSSSSGSQSQRTQRTDALARAMYRASASDDPETIKMIRDGFGVCGSIKQLQAHLDTKTEEERVKMRDAFDAKYKAPVSTPGGKKRAASGQDSKKRSPKCPTKPSRCSSKRSVNPANVIQSSARSAERRGLETPGPMLGEDVSSSPASSSGLTPPAAPSPPQGYQPTPTRPRRKRSIFEASLTSPPRHMGEVPSMVQQKAARAAPTEQCQPDLDVTALDFDSLDLIDGMDVEATGAADPPSPTSTPPPVLVRRDIDSSSAVFQHALGHRWLRGQGFPGPVLGQPVWLTGSPSRELVLTGAASAADALAGPRVPVLAGRTIFDVVRDGGLWLKPWEEEACSDLPEGRLMYVKIPRMEGGQVEAPVVGVQQGGDWKDLSSKSDDLLLVLQLVPSEDEPRDFDALTKAVTEEVTQFKFRQKVQRIFKETGFAPSRSALPLLVVAPDNEVSMGLWNAFILICVAAGFKSPEALVKERAMPGECVRAQDLAPGMIPTVTEITRRVSGHPATAHILTSYTTRAGHLTGVAAPALVALWPTGKKLDVLGDVADDARHACRTALSFLELHYGRLGTSVARNSRVTVQLDQQLLGRIRGQSLGAACCLTMMSHLTGRPLRDDVAVVGELRLSGHLDPVSSLQVKADAAITSKLKYLLVPRGNLTDNGHLQSMEEGRPVTVTLSRDKAEGLTVLGVDTMFEVIDLCLMPVFGHRTNGARPHVAKVRGLMMPSAESSVTCFHLSEAALVEPSDQCDSTDFDEMFDRDRIVARCLPRADKAVRRFLEQVGHDDPEPVSADKRLVHNVAQPGAERLFNAPASLVAAAAAARWDYIVPDSFAVVGTASVDGRLQLEPGVLDEGALVAKCKRVGITYLVMHEDQPRENPGNLPLDGVHLSFATTLEDVVLQALMVVGRPREEDVKPFFVTRVKDEEQRQLWMDDKTFEKFEKVNTDSGMYKMEKLKFMPYAADPAYDLLLAFAGDDESDYSRPVGYLAVLVRDKTEENANENQKYIEAVVSVNPGAGNGLLARVMEDYEDVEQLTALIHTDNKRSLGLFYRSCHEYHRDWSCQMCDGNQAYFDVVMTKRPTACGDR